jgi:predicted metal-dependent hydrolase
VKDQLSRDTVEWNGVPISYSYCHSRRRTLGITVRPDKTVAVRVPLRTSVTEIRRFVTMKAAWVIKVWERQDARPVERQQSYQDGALFLLQGRKYELRLGECEHSSLELVGDFLILSAPHPRSEQTIRRQIDVWYRKQAIETVQERFIHCHHLMQQERIPLPPVTIRSMKTRWGSYSYRTRRVSLNLHLIKAPTACLDYVIIHELCHIKLRHHGADFWALVERYVPDYRSIRIQLRQYSRIY